MTAEKLNACTVSNIETNADERDPLLEEQRFVSGIRLDILLERLVLHERVIRPEKQVTGEGQTQYAWKI
jgi:hypothetical protein